MSCAAPTACFEQGPQNRKSEARPQATVLRLAEAAPRIEARRESTRWTRSELAAVVGSTITAISLGSLLAFEFVTKLQAPTVF